MVVTSCPAPFVSTSHPVGTPFVIVGIVRSSVLFWLELSPPPEIATSPGGRTRRAGETDQTLGARRTRRTGEADRTLRTCRASRTREADRTLRAGRTRRTGCTGCTGCAGCADVALISFRANGTGCTD